MTYDYMYWVFLFVIPFKLSVYKLYPIWGLPILYQKKKKKFNCILHLLVYNCMKI